MLDRLLLIALALLPLLFAYFLTKITLFIFSRVWSRSPLAQTLITHLKKPLLFIFLIAAAFISLRLLLIPQQYEEMATHGLIVLLIASLGTLIASITSAIYHFVRQMHRTESLEDFSGRSFITRAQILYRSVMFLILVMTLAFILMTFPEIKNFGLGILGSAGVAGLAIGLAAKPILTNLIAGFQIAFTRMVKIGDAIVIDGEFGFIEQIYLTHVTLKTWDLRRVVIPISNFIDKPYQNWSGSTTELLSIVTFSCDYRVPISTLRAKFEEILQATPLWNRQVGKLEVIDLTDQVMKIRLQMSVDNPGNSGALQAHMREKMIEFLQQHHPEALPHLRYTQEKI